MGMSMVNVVIMARAKKVLYVEMAHGYVYGECGHYG
jgi:hypothetical protein